MFNKIWAGVVNFFATEVADNKATIEKDLGLGVQVGEADIVAAVTKFNAEAGAVLSAVIAALGPNLPTYEGDAVDWVVNVLQAYAKQLGG